MPKFFVDENQIVDDKIKIVGNDVNHIKNVLRKKEKDSLVICNTSNEKDYLVDMTNNIVILNYLDILWAYPYEQRYNGMLINKCLKIVDKNNKRYEIASTKLLDKNKDEILQEILEALQEKNKDIILGFNKENKNIVKEKFKNLKASNKENNKL